IDVCALFAAGCRVGNLGLHDFLHVAAYRVGDLGADLGAFLEAAARTFAVIGAALLVDIGAHDTPGRRVRDLLDAGVRDLDGDLLGDLVDVVDLDPLGLGPALGDRRLPTHRVALTLLPSLASSSLVV